MKQNERRFFGAFLGLFLLVAGMGADMFANRAAAQQLPSVSFQDTMAILPKPGGADDGPPASVLA